MATPKQDSTPIDQHEGKKYLRTIWSAFGSDKPIGVPVDVYAVLEAFGVTCPARQHALKKLLCCGNRNKGSELQDLIGALAAVNRAIELQKVRDAERSATPVANDKAYGGVLGDLSVGRRDATATGELHRDAGKDGESGRDGGTDGTPTPDIVPLPIAKFYERGHLFEPAVSGTTINGVVQSHLCRYCGLGYQRWKEFGEGRTCRGGPRTSSSGPGGVQG